MIAAVSFLKTEPGDSSSFLSVYNHRDSIGQMGDRNRKNSFIQVCFLQIFGSIDPAERSN